MYNLLSYSDLLSNELTYSEYVMYENFDYFYNRLLPHLLCIINIEIKSTNQQL